MTAGKPKLGPAWPAPQTPQTPQTPFDIFFAANMRPVPGVDAATMEQVKATARIAFAECWNAAIDAAFAAAAHCKTPQELQFVKHQLQVLK